MYRVLLAARATGAAALLILPALLLLNAFLWHDRKKTAGYAVFACYLVAVGALVGLPGPLNLHFDPTLNLLPLAGLAADAVNAVLNVLLFVPFGLLAPLLWRRFGSLRRLALLALAFSGAIEFLQLFTFRTSDVNDLLMNTLGAVVGGLLARLLPPGANNPPRDIWLLAALAFLVMNIVTM